MTQSIRFGKVARERQAQFRSTLSTGAQVNLEFGGNNDEITVANSHGLTLSGAGQRAFNNP